MYSSMQQSHPAPLAGKGNFPLPGIDNFDTWDQQDGLHGKRNILGSIVYFPQFIPTTLRDLLIQILDLLLTSWSLILLTKVGQ